MKTELIMILLIPIIVVTTGVITFAIERERIKEDLAPPIVDYTCLVHGLNVELGWR